MPRPRTVQCLAVLTAVAVLSACGTDTDSPSVQKPPQAVSGDQRSILATVDALQTASRKGDGQAVCGDLFTRRLVKSVETSSKRSCAKEVRQRLFAPDAEISVGRDIKVSGDRGTVVVREQNGDVSQLSFVERDARWRIDRVTPQKSG